MRQEFLGQRDFIATQFKEVEKKMDGPFKEAAVPWQQYEVDVTEYRKTEKYQDYMKYLAELKASPVTQIYNRPHESKHSSNAYSIRG